MQCFRGYIPTRDKQAMQPFKERKNLPTLEEVQDLDEYAGVLGNETILIDVDDAETSELLFRIVQDLELKCRVYATTRGKHFLFKNTYLTKSWTKCTLAVGITTDGKVGANNSYEILKSGGVERPILYDFPEGEIQELPKWLTPVKSNYDFPNLGEGDGRNQTLFNYILTLQSDDFTKEEARECIRLINRYVLKKPLSDKELDVILRDDAFQKQAFFKGTKFLHDKFATYLKNDCHIIKINGQLHTYAMQKKFKSEEPMGTGAIEGIAASEAANNAAAAGAFAPLLALGIPGSGTGAVLLGGLMMWGLNPGPLLFDSNPEFCWGLISSMYMANVFTLLVAILVIPFLIKILSVPVKYMIPIITCVCIVGAYSTSNSMYGVIIMFISGIVGYLLDKNGFPTAPMLLAFVLAPMLEKNMRKAFIASQGSLNIFVDSTLKLVLLAVFLVLILTPVVKSILRKMKAGKAQA